MASNEGPGGERTEPATPKKRREAREKGQVRKSQELVSALMLLIMFGALSLLGPGMWGNMQSLVHTGLTLGWQQSELLLAADIPRLMQLSSIEFARIVLPLLLIAFAAAICVNVVQIGFLFSSKALTPKFSRLNPMEGIKRMFSTRTLFEMAKTIVKVIVIGVVAYDEVIKAAPSFSMMAGNNINAAIGATALAIRNAGFKIGLALLIIAIFDFLYQWFKYEKDLRMTKYEVKVEYKQTEGDPQIKGRIRQKQRQMAAMRTMEAIPQADVVITNPTHFAVALKYDAEVSDAPMVIAKGQDYLAQRIKQIAKENDVEIVENKEVARSLYAMCEVGDAIPLELYQAVAEILARVFKSRQGK
ncbi:MAG: flagellar biosynthesis protein FlhB [Clostridia bacterium]|nr:flagellar biosynthesis protein FlhB [Clostridia bacterium]